MSIRIDYADGRVGLSPRYRITELDGTEVVAWVTAGITESPAGHYFALVDDAHDGRIHEWEPEADAVGAAGVIEAQTAKQASADATAARDILESDKTVSRSDKTITFANENTGTTLVTRAGNDMVKTVSNVGNDQSVSGP